MDSRCVKDERLGCSSWCLRLCDNFFIGWQYHSHSRTLSFFAFDIDPAGVAFDNIFEHVKPQAVPRGLKTQGIVRAKKFIKNMIHLVSGYADASISNRDCE